jgi:DNA (cytosine-5)-methyltransferase 1
VKLSVVDFFCGCGGTSAGLRAAGMEVITGIDVDDIALQTFQNNFPNAKAIKKDVTKLSCAALSRTIKGTTRPLLFAACAPCQPFSQQNRHKDNRDDRVVLLDEFHKFVRHFKPDFIILENVPGMQKIQEGPFVRFTALLEELGYNFDHDVMDAKAYGVPQTRRRLVLVAALKVKIKLPVATHGNAENLADYRTVREAIAHYPALGAGQCLDTVPNHHTANITDINLERLYHTPEGGDRRDWPDRLLLKCHRKQTGYTDTYGRLSWSEPAKTLTTKCTSVSNGRFGHPEQNRALSVREAAALQSFPDDFKFVGTVSQAARQVGNAVPVEFAKSLGEQIMLSFEGS